MKANLKNIIFDWGGVLIDLDMNNTIKAFDEIGISDLASLLKGAEECDLFGSYERGDCTTDEFRTGIRQLANCTITDYQIDHIWNSMVKNVPVEKLQLLAELREKYSLYLLSNTNELHWDYASARVFHYKGLERDDFFNKIFLSFRMHLAKPDPKIFQVALTEAGLQPEETLFIDDSLVNCQAAASVKIQTAHYIPGTDLRAVLPNTL